MKKKIRIFSIFLCLSLVLSCFAACSKDENPDDTQAFEQENEPVVIELGAVIDDIYTIVEIDRSNNTCLAVLLDSEDSYREETYTEGREYDIDTQELLRLVQYTRDSKNRVMEITYTDPATNELLGTEEFEYDAQGRLTAQTTRNAMGITESSTAYQYNDDGTYVVSISESGRIVSMVTYSDNTVIERTDYTYSDDGSYGYRTYKDGKLMLYINYGADGNEITRAEYTYNTDGTFSVALYENGVLTNQQTGTEEEIQTQPQETTTEPKEVLDSDAVVVVPTTIPATENNPTTTRRNSDNDNNNNNNDDTTTTTKQAPPTTTTTQPAVTDASGDIDMLKQSKIFRSQTFCMTGYINEADEITGIVMAVTPTSTYAAMEMDFGLMMDMGSTGISELGFLATTDGKYYMIDPKSKSYSPMDESAMAIFGTESPTEIFDEFNFSDLILPVDKNASPDKTESTTWNGTLTTCYTFNLASGAYQKHYVDNEGRLLHVEDYSENGSKVNEMDIASLSDTVEDYMRTPPADYTSVDLMAFMLNMLGDVGTVVQ